MSKQEFYVCDGIGTDGKKCGVILVNDTDGRVIKGTVKKPTAGDSDIDTGDGERALCMACLRGELGLEPGKTKT